ncbi:MAG: ribonuclease P protein component [Gammaproteobacteria bacterium]|nr:ribonuclease P protein component [Gammaproteobacteria bacterium]
MNAFAFRRHQRLLNAHDFKQVFDQVDIKIGNDAMLLLAHRIEPTASARLGLIAAKKHLKRAVDRNHFKRQAREAFRHHQQQLVGFELIVMTRPGIRNLSAEQLRDGLDQCLNRVIRRAMTSSQKTPNEGKLEEKRAEP